MTANPDAITVLCYGDSNTYGQHPDKIHRYPANVRWTGRLQQLLGDACYIVEEGLGSRTTDLDYDRKPGRNGKTYLAPCLQSHNPLDIIIIMLGTNDLKMEYRRKADEIAAALASLVDDVRQYAQGKDGAAPKILLVSPTLINDQAPNFAKFYTEYYDAEAVAESYKLAAAIALTAKQLGCGFFEAATVAEGGDDGLHWSEPSHERFAANIEQVVRNWHE
jgi:lysophospholipase L1-like esterase